MSICSCCGKESNTNFCPVCGIQLNNGEDWSLVYRAMQPAELAERLCSYRNQLLSHQQLYTELYALQRTKTKAEKFAHSTTALVVAVVLGILLSSQTAGLGLGASLLITNADLIGVAMNGQTVAASDDVAVEIIMAVAFVCGLVGLVAPIAVVLIMRNAKKKKVERCNRRMGELGRVLVSEYRSIKQPLVPFQYYDPHGIQPLLELSSQGKATSVAQAIELYELQLQREAKEKAMEQRIRQLELERAAIRGAMVYSALTPKKIYV